MERGEFVEFAIGVDDRTFVGADSVSAGFERRYDVLDSGMAATAVERTGLKENVGLGRMEPFSNICGLHGGWRRPRVIQQIVNVKTLGVGDPADTARSDAGELPRDCVVPLKNFFLRREQADEFLADIAESDESEIIGANRTPPIGTRPLKKDS
jgi:hypothetical protein